MISSERSTICKRAPAQNHAGRPYFEQNGGDRDLPGSSPARARCVVLRRGLHAEHDAADGRDEQHDRRDLEGEQVIGEEEPADLGRAPERAGDLGAVRESPPSALVTSATITSIMIAAPTTNAPSWSHCGPPAQGASARPPR